MRQSSPGHQEELLKTYAGLSRITDSLIPGTLAVQIVLTVLSGVALALQSQGSPVLSWALGPVSELIPYDFGIQLLLLAVVAHAWTLMCLGMVWKKQSPGMLMITAAAVLCMGCSFLWSFQIKDFDKKKE
jgi:hypothetical protein